MACGDGRLHLVRPGPAAAQGGVQDPGALLDLATVPAGAVLVCQQDEVTGIIDPGGAPGVLEEHQRQQAGRLGLIGHELGQRLGQPDGLPRAAISERTVSEKAPSRASCQLAGPWRAAVRERARQVAPGGGAQDGSRFSLNAAIPSAASAEVNSAWETSVVRVNASSRAIPGIL